MILTIKTNKTDISMGIISSTRSAINSRMHLVAQDIRRDLQKTVEDLLKNSPEYKSLSGGMLMAEFGLDNPDPALNDILTVIRNSIDVSVVPVMTIGERLTGGINVTILRNAIKDIINLSSGKYEGKLFNIPWLEWLLTQGDRIIIAGYHITYNITPAQNKASRSGVAVMESGGGWRVPPQFSGTEDNNWISRTFNPAVIKSYLDSIVEKHMRRRL